MQEISPVVFQSDFCLVSVFRFEYFLVASRSKTFPIRVDIDHIIFIEGTDRFEEGGK